MTNEDLKIKITELLATATFEEGSDPIAIGFLTIAVDAKDLLSFAQQIRDNDTLNFNYLTCLTCVDWKTHLTMVYHLRSTAEKYIVVIKAKVDRNNAAIATVSDIWRTAEFHEREAYDLFGVQFIGHPDLRRLFLTEDYEGFPLRKDFEDPVNMIKL